MKSARKEHLQEQDEHNPEICSPLGITILCAVIAFGKNDNICKQIEA